MGKLEFSDHAASIFSELEKHTNIPKGQAIMYSSLLAEIEGLELVRMKILEYRDYHFWSDIAMNKGMFVVDKLNSKITKFKKYLKIMPLDRSVSKCDFWNKTVETTGLKW